MEEIGARLSLKERAQFSSEAKKASEDVKRIGTTAEETSSRSRGAFGRMGGAFGGLISHIRSGVGLAIGFMGFYGLERGIHGVIDATVEYQKVNAQTVAVLKSTGGAANVTRKQVEGLSKSLEEHTTFSQEDIQKAENMMLTFTKVRNEVGKGNDIFNQANKTVLDMSTALGGDATTNALRLGKALNDPVLGASALRRVGVAFSTEQTDMIKKMVASGHTLQAQKYILKELQTEFGGSAKAAGETFGGALDRLKHTATSFLREEISHVLPTFSKGVSYIADHGLPAFKKGLSAVGDWFHQNRGTIDAMGHAIGTTLILAFHTVYNFIVHSAIPVLRNLVSTLDPLVLTAFHVVAGAISAAAKVLRPLGHLLVEVSGFMKDHKTIVQTVAVMVLAGVAAYKIWRGAILAWQAVTKAATAVQVAFNAVMDANPVMLVIIALVALTAGIIYAYKHSETFRKIVHAAFHDALAVVQAVWHWIKNNWPYLLGILLGPFGFVVGWVIKHWKQVSGALQHVWNWIKGNWPMLLEVLFGPFGLAEHMIRTHWTGIMNFFKGIPGELKRLLSHMWDPIWDGFKWAINMLIGAWDGLHFSLGGWTIPVPFAPDIHVPKVSFGVPQIPKLHQGGTVTSGGLTNIQPSEELVYLPPAASVVPLGDARTVPGSLAAGGDGQPTTIQLVVDRKVLAETVYDHTKNKVARR